MTWCSDSKNNSQINSKNADEKPEKQLKNGVEKPETQLKNGEKMDQGQKKIWKYDQDIIVDPVYKEEANIENLMKFMKLENANRAKKSIVLPLKHIMSKGGKNLRSRLLKVFFEQSGEDKQITKKEQALLELVQNLTLLLDDIEDGSLMRRGLPCAHLVYGVPQTINSANYFSFAIIKMIVEQATDEHLREILLNFLEGVFKLHEGQAMEMYWRDNLIVPTEEEYAEMIDLKTGTFFKCIASAFFFKGKNKSEEVAKFDRLFYLIGLYFQTKDDLINLNNPDYSELKGFADDISEGKFSFPIIHACRKFPEDSTIINILKLRTQDIELKKLVISKLEEAGSFKYTESVLEKIAFQIKDEMMKFKERKPLINFIKDEFLLGTHKFIIDF